MTGEGFDLTERRIANDGRRHRLSFKEILDLAAGKTAVNNVSGNDDVTGGLRGAGNAAKATASIQQDLIAVEILNLEQPHRDPNRLDIVICSFTFPDM